MTRPTDRPRPGGKRGNPNWCKPQPPRPHAPTEFEIEVKRLGLAKVEYVASAKLKLWCAQNRNRVYVPEDLLKAWGIVVEANLSDAA